MTLRAMTSTFAIGVIALAMVSGDSREASAQVPVAPEKIAPPAFSTHGILIDRVKAPVYGFANLKPTTWLGLPVFHANFVKFDSKGKHKLGNVAIAPSAQPGVYIWVSDIGPTGIVQATGQSVIWMDSTKNGGTYVPL